MRIFIEGFGLLATKILEKIIHNHKVLKSNIYINTYKRKDNSTFINFLNREKLKKNFHSFKEKSTFYEVEQFAPDYIISIYGRRIIPSKILNLAKKKSFNFHPSLLPNYKGCFSCSWPIINQEKLTGVTIHEMTDEIDNGDILFQKEVFINSNETAFSLYQKLTESFVENFDNFFDSLVKNNISPLPMPLGGKYFPRKLPFNGLINTDWQIEKIDAFIRGMFFPPHKGAMIKINESMTECKSIQDFIKIRDLF